MRYYLFDHRPTEKELRKLTKQHLRNYHDHCRIWYWNGRKESYVNDTPDFYYSPSARAWKVFFYSSELKRLPIRFTSRDVVRYKRVVEKKA